MYYRQLSPNRIQCIATNEILEVRRGDTRINRAKQHFYKEIYYKLDQNLFFMEPDSTSAGFYADLKCEPEHGLDPHIIDRDFMLGITRAKLENYAKYLSYSEPLVEEILNMITAYKSGELFLKPVPSKQLDLFTDQEL